jgi:hypothetical protein
LAERPEDPAGTGQVGSLKPWHFGYAGRPDRDPRVNGSAGGKAPRRSRLEQQLRQKVVDTKNGMAAMELLKLELDRQAARDRLVYAKDEELCEMDELLAGVTAERDAMLEQLRVLDERVEARERQLEAALTDETVLRNLLRNCDQAALERTLIAMGFEDVDVEADDVAP